MVELILMVLSNILRKSKNPKPLQAFYEVNLQKWPKIAYLIFPNLTKIFKIYLTTSYS